MSKKYVPSGYQIINIDVSDKTSGTPFTPETEDEKLLYKIISEQQYKKPILLHVISSNYELCGFGVINGDSITIIGNAIGSSVSEKFVCYFDGTDVIEWEEIEE